jgi:hypothetical protein
VSVSVRIDPVGLCGEFVISSFVRGVITLATSSTSIRKSFASRNGAATAVPPT